MSNIQYTLIDSLLYMNYVFGSTFYVYVYLGTYNIGLHYSSLNIYCIQ